MAQTLTLLNAVNATVWRAGISAKTLTAFTGQGADQDIAVLVQSWNDIVHHILRALTPAERRSTANLTLVTDIREYDFDDAALPSDVEKIVWPLHDETNGYYILEYPGGYERMRNVQLQPANWTGRPLFAAINPTNGKLRLDRIPTSDENGDVYVMLYDKSVNLAATTDTFPFSDDVVRALYGPVVAWWKMIKAKQQPTPDAIIGFGTAVEMASKGQRRRGYIARR